MQKYYPMNLLLGVYERNLSQHWETFVLVIWVGIKQGAKESVYYFIFTITTTAFKSLLFSVATSTTVSNSCHFITCWHYNLMTLPLASAVTFLIEVVESTRPEAFWTTELVTSYHCLGKINYSKLPATYIIDWDFELLTPQPTQEILSYDYEDFISRTAPY